MITANPTAFGKWFWQTTGRIGIRRRFKAFELINPVQVAEDQSVILVGNHISWWDGFFAIEMNRQLWKKEFHVMMLEEQLRKRPFMRQTGAYSVQPGTRDVVNTIAYSIDLLKTPENLILIFPQGNIHSQYDRALQFNKGVEKICLKSPNSHLVFFATFFDYGSFATPIVRVYSKMASSKIDIESQYNSFFKDAERDHIQAINE